MSSNRWGIPDNKLAEITKEYHNFSNNEKRPFTSLFEYIESKAVEWKLNNSSQIKVDSNGRPLSAERPRPGGSKKSNKSKKTKKSNKSKKSKKVKKSKKANKSKKSKK